MCGVIWKPIPGATRYSASSNGQIRRDVRMHNSLPGIVQQRPDSYGYLSVNLTDDDGRQRKLQVHTVVAAAHFGVRPDGLVTCHGRAGMLVNSIDNLRYDTPKSNSYDRLLDGTDLRGEDVFGARLTGDQVIAIHARCCAGEKQGDVAKDYGVNQGTVANIMRRKTWRHLDLPRGPVRFISEEVLADAAMKYRAGRSINALAKDYGFSPPGLRFALRRHPKYADLCQSREAKSVKAARASEATYGAGLRSAFESMGASA